MVPVHLKLVCVRIPQIGLMPSSTNNNKTLFTLTIMSTTNEFNTLSFGLRYLFAVLLVLLTFNPSGYSWVHWLSSETPAVYKAVAGIILLIGWVVYLRATWYSIGLIGTIIAAALFGVIVWLFVEWGLLTLDNSSVITWVVEFIASGVLAVGMSWAHIRRRLSGQYTTDEADA